MPRLPLAALMLAAGTAAAPAAPLADGRHRVVLETAQGEAVEIAVLEVAGGAYTVTRAAAPFTDHFLSMRPFKCLEGPDKHWCHVPYPYEIARATGEGLTDLEYDFLFLWKNATDYGINMWNGVYYVLSDGPDGITGHLHEMDMDILSAPPEAGDLRPVTRADLEPGEPDSHWLPVLRIIPD